MQMNTIVKPYITRLGRSYINEKISKEQKRQCANEHNCEVLYNKIRGGHILIKRYLISRKDDVQMTTIVKSYITRLGPSFVN